MRVILTIDPNDHHDRAMRDEAVGWMHYSARAGWTVQETEGEADDDDDGRIEMILTFQFDDPLDGDDLYRRLYGRGRRI